MKILRKVRSAHTLVRRRYLYWLWRVSAVSQAKRIHSLPGPLIISLTSYPPRFPNILPVLKSILSQNIRPDLIILWIAEDDYHKLPNSIFDLQLQGLTILKCRDLRSYKKLIPALESYPGHFIVTADDDILYKKSWLKSLVDAYDGNDKHIVCARAHTVTLNTKGHPQPYRLWRWESASTSASRLTFPTSGAGALYPPGIFDARVTDERAFTSLSPDADDLWFYWMALLNGASFRQVGPQDSPLIVVRQSQSVTLARTNNGDIDGNSVQMNRLLHAYGFPSTTAEEINL